MKNQQKTNYGQLPQCQFAELSENVPRCKKEAVTNVSGYWFCAEHAAAHTKLIKNKNICHECSN